MGTPISLYIALEDGRKADLEVVARASLAFARALRESAAMYDPLADVRIELINSTEGSLSLNAVVSWLKSKTGIEDEAALRAAVIALSVWFTTEVGNWGVAKALDHLTNQNVQQTLKLSDEELQKLAEMVAVALERRVADLAVKEVYRELEQDPAVIGVGTTIEPGAKPKEIVPKAQFRERSALETEVPAGTRRDTISNETVRLIRPVLLESNRRWRFAGRTGEFGAPIKDETFLHNLMTGQIDLPMTGGIQLDILLEVKEENRAGVWTVLERNVLEVRHVHPPQLQQSLFSDPP